MLLAGDRYTAYTYEEDFTLGSDGLLSIYFAATKDQATVAGIEIKLPAVVRIDAGSTGTFQDELAPQPHVWQADNYFTGSVSSSLYNILQPMLLCDRRPHGVRASDSEALSPAKAQLHRRNL